MAEILLRVVDKGPSDITSKAGDVLSVCPDSWAWSTEELTNPAWRIVSVNVLQSTIDAVLTPGNDAVTGRQKRLRDWTVDFTKAPDPSLFTGARTQAIISMTRKQATDMISKKP